VARVREAWRWAIAAGAVAVAYRRSLGALAEGLAGQSPLAYLGLVPVIALAVCLVRSRPGPGELRLPHRHVDWMLGLPLLAGAAVVTWLLPPRLSYWFWLNRIDLLALPLFAAGIVSVVLGARVLHRVWLPILLLALAWPYPWQRHVAGFLRLATGLALAAVRAASPLVPGVEPAGDSVFDVGAGGGRFVVEVGSACSGANGAVGFLVVGGGVVLACRGHAVAKLAWLAAGTALVVALNVVRILSILAAGARFGRHASLGVLHPVLGLALLALATVVMVGLLPRFGLARRPRAAAGAAPGGRALTAPALALVVTAALAFGGANDGLARFEPYGTAEGGGDALALALSGPRLDGRGWSAERYATVGWASQYFGPAATWSRYLVPTPAGATAFLDVVASDDLGSFATFGLEACYRFHGFGVAGGSSLDLGAPAPGRAVAFHNRDTGSWWAVVSWVWPVRGGDARYERVSLLRPTTAAPGEGGDAELVAVARAIVADRSGAHDV
jgi:exosortase/archaeosortase family protein